MPSYFFFVVEVVPGDLRGSGDGVGGGLLRLLFGAGPFFLARGMASVFVFCSTPERSQFLATALSAYCHPLNLGGDNFTS